MIEDIVNVAEKVGMNGEGYVWIFAEGIDIEFLPVEQNSHPSRVVGIVIPSP